MYVKHQSIQRYKLDRLKEELANLSPEGGSQVGNSAIVSELQPLAIAAQKRGCSVASIAALLQAYGLSLTRSELGLARRH